MTIKAIAVKDGMENSNVAEAEYTINLPLETMQAIFDRATAIGGTAQNVGVIFHDWVVSGVSTDGKTAYVTDNNGKGFMTYHKDGIGFSTNDKLSGTIESTPLKLYNGASEFTNLKKVDVPTVTNDGTITVLTKTIDQLSGVNTASVITINNVTYNSTGTKLVDASSNEIKLYDQLFDYGSSTFTNGHVYNVTGVYVQFGNTKEIAPRSAADIVEVVYTVTVNQPAAGGEISSDKATAKFGETVTLTATPADNYRFNAWTVMCGESSVTVNNNKFTMPKGNVTVTGSFVPTYTITLVKSPDAGGTTFTASPSTTAAEGDEITLAATAATGYRFGSFTVVDADAGNVTVANNKFTMPGKNVTATANFIKTYTVAYNNNGGTGSMSDTGSPYDDGASVTVKSNTFTAPTGKLFEKWNTTADGSGTDYTAGQEFTIAEDMTFYAQWRDIVYHITYNVNGNTSETEDVAFGGTTSYQPSMSPLTFVGWSLTDGGASVGTTYSPTGNTEEITLYAVFGAIGNSDLTLTSADMPTSYPSDGTIREMQGVKFGIYNIGHFSNNGKIQFKKFDNSKPSYIYNNEYIGRITSIVLEYNSSNYTILTVKAGTTANPTGGTTISSTETSGATRTFDFTTGDYSYFVITNGDATTTLNSITIYYEGNVPFTITNVTGATEISSIPANTAYVVKDGGILTYTGASSGTSTSTLIIEDGGQLITSNAVQATVKKDAAAASDWGEGEYTPDGWYFIASPLSTAFNPAGTSMLSNNYDLYYLSNDNSKWMNYKQVAFSLVNGTGYLYANDTDVTIEFAGEIVPYTTAGNAHKVTLTHDGWTLLGNPYTRKVIVDKAFVTLHNAASTTSNDAGSYIMPCRGFAVNGSEGDVVTFTLPDESVAPNSGNIQIALAQTVASRGESNEQTIDNAVVSFNESSTLPKFYFGTQNANIYIPQGDKEYAVVSAEPFGTIPVNFRAEKDGQYTLNIGVEEVEMNYLHLIDNMTGADVDLLVNPSYTFNARNNDYESRFKLVFSNSNTNEAEANSDFAFISNGNLIVAGTGTLQIVDMMGRVVSTYTTDEHITTNSLAQGVYVLRLVNGDNVKTQKIVVK